MSRGARYGVLCSILCHRLYMPVQQGHAIVVTTVGDRCRRISVIPLVCDDDTSVRRGAHVASLCGDVGTSPEGIDGVSGWVPTLGLMEAYRSVSECAPADVTWDRICARRGVSAVA